MTTKQSLIFEYLIQHKGEGYYIDIRDSVGIEFENEDDFDKTIQLLIDLNLITENDDSDTLYKIKSPIG